MFLVLPPVHPKHTRHVIINLYFCCRHKAKRKSFKPDVTADNEERHKASPYIDPVQHRQEDCEVVNSESIEMTQVQATNDSQGTEKEQLIASNSSFCSFRVGL